MQPTAQAVGKEEAEQALQGAKETNAKSKQARFPLIKISVKQQIFHAANSLFHSLIRLIISQRG
jgi:hypothetical protein